MIYPLKVTKEEIRERHINLLLTDDDKGMFHYSTIINFSGLLNGQYNKCKTKIFYCHVCLHGFKKRKDEAKSEDCKRLQEHQKYCKTNKPQIDTKRWILDDNIYIH